MSDSDSDSSDASSTDASTNPCALPPDYNEQIDRGVISQTAAGSTIAATALPSDETATAALSKSVLTGSRDDLESNSSDGSIKPRRGTASTSDGSKATMRTVGTRENHPSNTRPLSKAESMVESRVTKLESLSRHYCNDQTAAGVLKTLRALPEADEGDQQGILPHLGFREKVKTAVLPAKKHGAIRRHRAKHLEKRHEEALSSIKAEGELDRSVMKSMSGRCSSATRAWKESDELYNQEVKAAGRRLEELLGPAYLADVSKYRENVESLEMTSQHCDDIGKSLRSVWSEGMHTNFIPSREPEFLKAKRRAGSLLVSLTEEDKAAEREGGQAADLRKNALKLLQEAQAFAAEHVSVDMPRQDDAGQKTSTERADTAKIHDVTLSKAQYEDEMDEIITQTGKLWRQARKRNVVRRRLVSGRGEIQSFLKKDLYKLWPEFLPPGASVGNKQEGRPGDDSDDGDSDSEEKEIANFLDSMKRKVQDGKDAIDALSKARSELAEHGYFVPPDMGRLSLSNDNKPPFSEIAKSSIAEIETIILELGTEQPTPAMDSEHIADSTFEKTVFTARSVLAAAGDFAKSFFSDIATDKFQSIVSDFRSEVQMKQDSTATTEAELAASEDMALLEIEKERKRLSGLAFALTDRFVELTEPVEAVADEASDKHQREQGRRFEGHRSALRAIYSKSVGTDFDQRAADAEEQIKEIRSPRKPEYTPRRPGHAGPHRGNKSVLEDVAEEGSSDA